MNTSDAVKTIEDALSAPVKGLAAYDPSSPGVREVVAVLRDRLVLAETALYRADNGNGVALQPGKALPQLFIIIRSNMTRAELAEWNRLARVISQMTSDLPASPATV